MQKIGLLFLVFMVMTAASSQAANEESTPPDTKPAPFEMDNKQQIRNPVPVKIKKAIDPTSLLSETGEIYSLTGLDIPDDNETAPKAQKRLAELTEGKKCTLYQTRSEKVGRLNRMNQIVGHFTCGKDDNWVQGAMLTEGLARVRTTPENKDQITPMLTLEQQARDKKMGLWALPMNNVFTPVGAAQRINGFGVVQGKVYATSQNRNAVFLNFTADWKTDFTIGIPSTLRKDFSKLRIDPMSLKGKTVRVRGWIRSYNGPYIEMDHVAQLEIIPDKFAPATPPQPEKKTNTDATKILDSIIDSTRPNNTSDDVPAAVPVMPVEKQFMHTIGSKKAQTLQTQEPPKIEEPTAPVVEKPVAPVQRKLNQ